MPNTTDPEILHPDFDKLCNSGQILLMGRAQVILEWEARIRAEIKAAKHLLHPVLVDSIPVYLKNLAEVLTTDYPRSEGSDFSTVAQEHGGERARLTFYDPDELIREYQVLKTVIFEFLDARVSLSREERLIIHRSFDVALREAAIAFALVQSGIREQFIATLTHDLRNPIAVVQMAAGLAQNSLDDPTLLTNLLIRIVDNAKRADRMILDLLDTTVVRSGGRLELEFVESDMLEIVEELVSQLKMAYGERLKVVGDSVKGVWNPDSLRRAIENLCANAVKYGDSDAPITITVSSMESRVIVEVHNQGPVIPTEEQETIFQVFRRANAVKHNKKRGWGLGLALVRGVAESHGGSIAVASSETFGTTFSIDIPIDARPFQQAPIT